MDGPLPDTTRNWKLLSSVVPQILEVAKFYTGNDAKAAAAREVIDRQEGGKEPFYANLCVELQSLYDYTRSWDASLPLPHRAVARVLEMLDNRCRITSRDKVALMEKVSGTLELVRLLILTCLD